jgi:hypothetical protein
MTHLLLTLALVVQSPGGGETPSGKAGESAKPPGEKAAAAKGSADAPKAKAGSRAGMSEAYKKELQATLAKRRSAARKRALTHQQKTQVEAAVAKAMSEWEAKVGPALAAQQREQMRLRILAQQTQAMQQMAEAAQMNAAANNARARLESQALGQSQIFVPGQGFIPYPYSIIQPIFPIAPNVPNLGQPATPTNPGVTPQQP